MFENRDGRIVRVGSDISPTTDPRLYSHVDETELSESQIRNRSRQIRELERQCSGLGLSGRVEDRARGLLVALAINDHWASGRKAASRARAAMFLAAKESGIVVTTELAISSSDNPALKELRGVLRSEKLARSRSGGFSIYSEPKTSISSTLLPSSNRADMFSSALLLVRDRANKVMDMDLSQPVLATVLDEMSLMSALGAFDSAPSVPASIAMLMEHARVFHGTKLDVELVSESINVTPGSVRSLRKRIRLSLFAFANRALPWMPFEEEKSALRFLDVLWHSEKTILAAPDFFLAVAEHLARPP